MLLDREIKLILLKYCASVSVNRLESIKCMLLWELERLSLCCFFKLYLWFMRTSMLFFLSQSVRASFFLSMSKKQSLNFVCKHVKHGR